VGADQAFLDRLRNAGISPGGHGSKCLGQKIQVFGQKIGPRLVQRCTAVPQGARCDEGAKCRTGECQLACFRLARTVPCLPVFELDLVLRQMEINTLPH